MLGEKLIRIFLNVSIVTVATARYLTVEEYGTLRYVVSYTLLLAPLATAGLFKIMLRKLSEHISKQEVFSYLNAGFWLRVVFGVSTYLLILVSFVVWEGTDWHSYRELIFGYQITLWQPDSLDWYGVVRSDLFALIAVIALSLCVLPVFEVTDFYFQSISKGKYGATAKLIGFVIAALVRLVFILLELPLFYIALSFVVEYLFVSILMFFQFKFRSGGRLRTFSPLKIENDKIRYILRFVPVMILIQWGTVANTKIDQILVEGFLGREAIAEYGLAVQITEMVNFAGTTFAISMQPFLIKAYTDRNTSWYHAILRKLYVFTIAISVTFAVGISLTAHWLVPFLLGDKYANVADILILYAWSSVPFFLGFAVARHLLTEKLEKFNMYNTIAGVLCNIALNVFLIPIFGIKGAILSTFFSYTMAYFISLFFYSETRHISRFILMLIPFYTKKIVSYIKI